MHIDRCFLWLQKTQTGIFQTRLKWKCIYPSWPYTSSGAEWGSVAACGVNSIFLSASMELGVQYKHEASEKEKLKFTCKPGGDWGGLSYRLKAIHLFRLNMRGFFAVQIVNKKTIWERNLRGRKIWSKNSHQSKIPTRPWKTDLLSFFLFLFLL